MKTLVFRENIIWDIYFFIYNKIFLFVIIFCNNFVIRLSWNQRWSTYAFHNRLRLIELSHERGFMCLWHRSLLIVCLAVTYKRIVPRQRILQTMEPSREPHRGNASRKRKKPGAGTYKTFSYNMHVCATWFASII